VNHDSSALKYRLATWLVFTFVAVLNGASAAASCGDYLMQGRHASSSDSAGFDVHVRLSFQLDLLRLAQAETPCHGPGCEQGAPRDFDETVATIDSDRGTVRVLGTTKRGYSVDDPRPERVCFPCDEQALSSIQAELFRPPMSKCRTIVPIVFRATAKVARLSIAKPR